jgi:hypothetical protein
MDQLVRSPFPFFTLDLSCLSSRKNSKTNGLASPAKSKPFNPHFDRHRTKKTLSGPSDQPLTRLLGDLSSSILENPNEGRRVDFKNGALLSHAFHSPPFLVYGDIFNLWKSLGEVNSPLGLPIADPQLLPDGSTCSIFEGGHVHKPPGAKEVEL